jgi:hypothetical protein
VSDSSEDNCLFKLLEVGHGGHTMVSESVQSLGSWGVLDAYPSFLIQEEQVNVVQKWCVEVLTDLIISTTHYHEGLVEGQEGHGVTYSSTWRIALLLYFLPLSRHNLSFNTVGLEVFEFCQKLTLGILTTEIVNTIKHSIRLKKLG